MLFLPLASSTAPKQAHRKFDLRPVGFQKNTFEAVQSPGSIDGFEPSYLIHHISPNTLIHEKYFNHEEKNNNININNSFWTFDSNFSLEEITFCKRIRHNLTYDISPPPPSYMVGE